MDDTQAILELRLEALVRDAFEGILRRFSQIGREANAVGMFYSGNRIAAVQDAALEAYGAMLTEVVRWSEEAAVDEDTGVSLIRRFGKRLADRIIEHLDQEFLPSPVMESGWRS